MSEARRPSPAEMLDDLLERLQVEEIDFNIFRGQNEPGRPGNLFGGQVAAQSLMSACRTVDGTPAHSLHGYFLRPGDPKVPVLFTVDRIRDGRSFATRRVVAQQRGKAIFNMSVSFHTPEVGYAHQVPMPDAPAPEEVSTWADHMEGRFERVPEDLREWAMRPRPVETRHIDTPMFLGGETREGPCQVWFRAAGTMPDDPYLHQCVLTYATDISLLDNILRPHGRNGELGPLMTASLDHAVWFHQSVRADQWLLYAQDSPAAFGARGLGRGTIYTRDGLLVASVVQEALMRPVSAPEDRSQ